MATMITFGTDGWRARLDGDFTDENLIRLADAAGAWWARQAPGALIYVGYDTRPGAERFAVLAGEVLAGHGLVAKVSDRPAPMPAVSWAVARDVRAIGGFEVTGSHNPPDYLGVKLCLAGGATLTQDAADAIEAGIDADPTEARGPIERKNFVIPYMDHLCEIVDGDAIARARLRVVCDPLYGAARGLVADALGALGVEVVEIHGHDDADTPDIHPDPIEPWIDDCEQAVVAHGACAGLITDGDADRAGAVDERGRCVSPAHLIALLTEHLVQHHGLSGRVVVNQSTPVIARRVAQDLGCRVNVKPVGFKHIYEEMRKGDVLIGGEEAGGIGIPAYCPERDGILANLLLCELMAISGKTLGELVDDLETFVGAPAKEIGAQPVTPKIREDALAGRSIWSPDRVTLMDFWVSYVAYFYDLNFRESLDIVDERDYVRRIIRRIPYTNPETAKTMEELEKCMIKYVHKALRPSA